MTVKVTIDVRGGSGVRMHGDPNWDLFATDGQYVVEVNGLYDTGYADGFEAGREAALS